MSSRYHLHVAAATAASASADLDRLSAQKSDWDETRELLQATNKLLIDYTNTYCDPHAVATCYLQAAVSNLLHCKQVCLSSRKLLNKNEQARAKQIN